jgi:hypothetical protein
MRIVARRIIKTGAYAFIALIILFISFLVLAIEKPREIGWAASFIANNITQFNKNTNTSFKNFTIGWNKEYSKFQINIDDLQVEKLPQNEIIAIIPKAEMLINIIDIITLGHFIPSNIMIHNPYFVIYNNENNNAKSSSTLSKNLLEGSIFAILYDQLTSHHLIKKKELKIDNIVIKIINNDKSEYTIKVPNIDVNFDNDSDNQRYSKIKTTLIISNGENIELINRMTSLGDGLLQNKFFFNNVQIDKIKPLLDINFDQYNISGVVSGNIKSLIDINKHKFLNHTAIISNYSGDIEIGKNINKILPIRNATSEVEINDNQYNIKNTDIILNDNSKLNISGSASLQNNKEYLQLNAKISNLNISKLNNYIPDDAENDVSNWIIQHIKNGNIKNADLKVNLKPEYFTAKTYPDDMISGNIDITDANIRYLDLMPDVKNIDANIKINTKNVTVNLLKGESEGNLITSGSIIIPILNNDNNLDVKIITKSNASNIINLIPKKYAADIPVSQNDISGQALTNININFPLTDDLNYDMVNFDIKTNIDNLNIKNFIDNPTQNKKIDLTSDKMIIGFNGKSIIADGLISYNNTPLNIKYSKELFSKNNNDKLIINAKLNEKSQLITPDILKINKGEASLEAQIQTINNIRNINAMFNGNNADFIIPKIGFAKEKDIKITAKFAITQNNPKDDYNIKTINIIGDNIKISGSAIIANNMSDLISANLDNIQYNINRYSLNIKNEKGYKNINISGKLIDLSKADLSSKGSSKDNENAKYNIRLDKVIMKNNQAITKLLINTTKTKGIYQHIKITGILNETNKFNVTLQKNKENNRILDISSDDGGALLAAVNAYPNIRGGKLHIQGSTNKKTPDIFNCNVDMKDYSIVKTPILTKLITLTSITGIINTISNKKGIDFETLKGKLHIGSSNVKFEEITLLGNALGLTINGEVNFDTDQTKINGTVIPPIYGLNKIVDNIPLLGKMLGGDGNGAIAANYKIEGNIADPSISVNPLSILLPGFIRKIIQ